jgi:cysteine desulfurase family protein (TIGR01976 family)
MFDVQRCRRQFPALSRKIHGQDAIYFDGPAGSQVPRCVVDAVGKYLLHTNANHGGAFTTARESDALLAEAHQAVADLLGTSDPDLVAFGPNMTTLTFALSRALARTWKPGDEVLVTRLDHDGNVTPWVLAARDAGATVRYVGLRSADCTLDLDDLRRQLSPRTRLVAVGCASNAVGTINPVQRIAAWAHAVGALVFLDAVHFAPHGLMDVTAWDCDFLACSAYKFFGPHVGILYGKRELLESLPAYKLRPVPDRIPDRWMTGTQSHEGIAGVLAAVEYLADIGRSIDSSVRFRREALKQAFAAIAEYERDLCGRLLQGLAKLSSIQVLGISDTGRLNERVPTVSFIHSSLTPRAVAEHLDRRGIFAWHGNFYALGLSETLGLEPEGMVRIGLLHYNTAAEVDRLLDPLCELESERLSSNR